MFERRSSSYIRTLAAIAALTEDIADLKVYSGYAYVSPVRRLLRVSHTETKHGDSGAEPSLPPWAVNAWRIDAGPEKCSIRRPKTKDTPYRTAPPLCSVEKTPYGTHCHGSSHL